MKASCAFENHIIEPTLGQKGDQAYLVPSSSPYSNIITNALQVRTALLQVVSWLFPVGALSAFSEGSDGMSHLSYHPFSAILGRWSTQWAAQV